MSLFLGEDAGDGSETPVLVGLVELGGLDSCSVKHVTACLERFFVSDSQVQVRGVMVRRAAILVGVFNGGVASLNSLLREWDIAARDGVQVGLGGNLRLHDVLRLVDETICVSD